MTVKEAYKILNLPPKTEWSEIKKRYRQLILQVHPDIGISPQEAYAYNAQEINLAYSVLKKEKDAPHKTVSHAKKQHVKETEPDNVWNVPANEHAYTEREILHYAEDCDGTVVGNFCVAKGKYLWTPEEDFPLFLLSIYTCSKLLLDEIDSSLPRKEVPMNRQQIQAELTYLLAQQFIDGTALLQEFAKEEPAASDGSRIFYISSMLESSKPAISLATGELLYPSKIRQHKLYLKNQSGQELGYLSFLDDRLYYIVIPLLEQKKVRIKVQAAENESNKRQKLKPAYQNLNLWIKLQNTVTNTMPESLNLQIEQLLDKYRNLP